MSEQGATHGRPRAVRVAASVLSWAAIALVAVAVLGLVLVALLPRVSSWHLVVVAGGSMEPTIPLGSLAVMREVDDPASLEPGDIIEYVAPDTGRVTTHRIVAVSEGGAWFETRGDANPVADRAPVPAELVRARYLLAVPYAGIAAEWLRSPAGYLALVLLPGLALIGWEITSIVRTLRRPATG